MTKKKKPHYFYCECVVGKGKPSAKCGSITIIDMGDGEFEIEGAYFKKPTVEKIIKLLSKKKK